MARRWSVPSAWLVTWRDHEQEWSPGRVHGGGACLGDVGRRGRGRRWERRRLVARLGRGRRLVASIPFDSVAGIEFSPATPHVGVFQPKAKPIFFFPGHVEIFYRRRAPHVVGETRSTTLLVADATGCAGGDR
eukprot:scaffold4514_cov62-Phaeocystis_antarctica.AAC.5